MSDTPVALSIVIPVYRVEDYVADTLRSCLDQDIPPESYEILCIDDGSPDRSAQIIAEMAAEHPNIRLIRRDNHGVSATRNFGLSEARGAYIWFVDSDDLVCPNCLGALLHIMEAEHPDYLQFGMQRFTDTPPEGSRCTDYEVCTDPTRIYDFLFEVGNGGVWRILFSRALLETNGIRFREPIRYSEDVLFGYEAIMAARKVAKTPLCGYFYRQRPGSAMHSAKLTALAESMRLLADAYSELAETCPEFYRAITLRKRDQSVRSLLFSLMQLGNVAHAKAVLAELTAKGYYPYPLNKAALRNNATRKQAGINRISYLFPKKWYFLTCVRLYGLLKGRKK